jgi:hypothetical protein
LPIFREADPIGVFSFWFGEPVLNIAERLLSIMPPATGSLLGDGVRGEELNLLFLSGDGDSGGVPPKVAAAIKVFKSDRELRRFFFKVFAVPLVSVGGGDALMMLSLEP